MNPRITRHPDGIFAVDAEYQYPGLAAAHVIVDEGRAAFVDTGTNNSVPYLLAALARIGVPRDSVDYVFLTHVHLDHAGGAGSLMRELPNARAVVHPRGAAHMIEPSRLIAGARAVYGNEVFDRLYGELAPIPADRVLSVPDGHLLMLGTRQLELIHTPGHALHHYVIVDAAHKCIFSGDTFGVSYRELDTALGPFIMASTTPAQFDPGQLVESIDRMLTYSPEAIYLTHYSRVTGIPRLAQMLKSQIDAFVRIAADCAALPDIHGAIRTAMFGLWCDVLALQGCTLPKSELARLLEIDLELNTQGLVVWLERQRKDKRAQA